MSNILKLRPLGFQWETEDPFLFCVHHDDAYPAGNEQMGPKASLAGRNLGQDFELRDGFRMYHGEVVPGFPQHPHRGFETVTLARRGYIDHSDSLGAAARFGRGDVQWMTAGGGVVHSEMFPLIDPEGPNPVELFQIWMNLPAKDKMVPAHFSMLWSEDIPRYKQDGVEITIVAGRLGEHVPPAPPPHSWASKPSSEVAIQAFRFDPGASYTLPAASPGLNRNLYLFAGGDVEVDGQVFSPKLRFKLRSDVPITIVNRDKPAELLLLQARPINEPVAQYGPFVMNTQDEIIKTYNDFRRTRFGGWPWKRDDPVHPRDEGRFARHADGRIDKPTPR